MHPVTPLPATGEVFLDARGPERALRVSWPAEDVPALVEALRLGLAKSYDVHRARLGRVDGDLVG
jgi:hypothetical protein